MNIYILQAAVIAYFYIGISKTLRSPHIASGIGTPGPHIARDLGLPGPYFPSDMGPRGPQYREGGPKRAHTGGYNPLDLLFE